MVAIVQRLGLCFVEAKMRVRFPLATLVEFIHEDFKIYSILPA